jgi:cell division septum initiation protein DivIVA
MTDHSVYPQLRYRRFGGGYRREEVLFHLRELETRVRGLEGEVGAARERSAGLVAELAGARAEIGALRAREHELDAALASANRRAQEVVETAQIEARKVLAQAEEQAARIRGEAHLKVDDVGKQLEEILQLRERMLGLLRGAVQDVGLAVSRIERGEPVFGTPAEERAAPTAAADRAPEPAHEPLPGDEEVFDRRVEIDAGPFADFATLSSFERSLAALPNVEDVYVRRFAGARATIELAMTHEQPLVRLLRGRLPYRFDAERNGAGTLRVNVLSPSLAGSR